MSGSLSRPTLAPVSRWSLPLVSALAGLAAAGLYGWLFRYGSLNNDEVAYLLQARAIAGGDLFLPVRAPAEAFQPWFFVDRPVGFVSKYLPLVSGLLAVGLRLTGSIVPVLALLAAAVPLLVARLAAEVGLPPRRQLAAAVLVSASPLVLMQSALPLSYLPFLVLACASWLLALRVGLGRAGAPSAVLLGATGSAAACARPYDAVLLLGPAVLWAAWQRRVTLLAAVGALPLTALVLAYDLRTTGSALSLPFGLLEPDDALGYGVRRLVPEEGDVDFGPLQAAYAMVLHFGLDPLRWYALGGLLVPAAALAWRRSNAAVRVLLACTAVHLVGYFFFWGPYNFSVRWGRGTRVLGPIYAVPLVVPVVLAGLPVLLDWLPRSRRLRQLAVVAGAVAVVQLGSAVVQASVDAGRTRTLLAAADRGRVGGLVRTDADPPYLGSPVSRLVDGVGLAAWLPVPPLGEPVPDLLQMPKAVYGTGRLAYALTRQQRVAGAAVELAVTLVDDRTADVLVVERAGRATACAFRPRVAVTVTPTGTSGCDDRAVPPGWPRNTSRRCPDLTCLVLVPYREDGNGDLRRRGWRQLQVATSDATVALVVDAELRESSGDGWVRVEPR